jgi:hypothetical protein
VNATHLAQAVGSATLRQIAERHGLLMSLAQDGLFLWRVQELDLPAIRSQLAGSDAIIQ